jgi:Papain-like cysteine protease AvrRpt2
MNMQIKQDSETPARAWSRALSRLAIIGTVAAGILSVSAIANATASPKIPGDYNGDGMTDATVWRPTLGNWYIRASNTGAVSTSQWGQIDDIPVSGDFDGDGRSDLAIWRTATGDWYIVNSSTGGGWVRQWGQTGDVPLTGDYDGDKKSDFVIWRPKTGVFWYVNSSTGGQYTKQWGQTGDIPVSGDFDGDGKSDFAVWRPSNGNWYITKSSNGATVTSQWGIAEDLPVPGDYDGDGKTDTAIWRPSTGTWWVMYSSLGQYATQQWGQAGDIPVTGNFDGDAKTDYAIWRPSTATWWVINSSVNQYWTTVLGQGGDTGGGVYSDLPLPAIPRQRNILVVELDPQQQSNWCWAATTQMIASYYDVAISQCSLANVNTGRTDCCTNASSAANTSLCNQGGWWMLTQNGFTVTDTWTPLTYAQLSNEFASNRPVAFSWGWTGGNSGHAMVANGVWTSASNQQWVTFNDPWAPNVGDRTDFLYTDWVSNSGHSHWKDTYNINK